MQLQQSVNFKLYLVSVLRVSVPSVNSHVKFYRKTNTRFSIVELQGLCGLPVSSFSVTSITGLRGTL